MRATPLSAADLHELTRPSCWARLAPPVERRWDDLAQMTPIATWRTFALGPDATPSAMRTLSADHPVSTTTLLRLSGPPEAPVLHGLVGDDRVPGSGRLLRSTPSCLDPLDGRQGPALVHRIPCPRLPRRRLPRLVADPAALRRWRFRVGDDVPLIGADPRSRRDRALFSSSAHRVD